MTGLATLWTSLPLWGWLVLALCALLIGFSKTAIGGMGLIAVVLTCHGMAEFRENYAKAVANDRTTVLYIETNLYGPNPPGSAWWDVPVSQVSELESTQKAYGEYVAEKAAQRHYL